MAPCENTVASLGQGDRLEEQVATATQPAEHVVRDRKSVKSKTDRGEVRGHLKMRMHPRHTPATGSHQLGVDAVRKSPEVEKKV